MSAAAARRLTPELEALLVCAQWVIDPAQTPRFRSALGRCASPQLLCRTAIAHGMIGHLRAALRTAPELQDTPLATTVAKVAASAARRGLRQSAVLLRLIDKLAGSGIEAMPIKGPAWAEALYGDVALRNWSDLDILVRYADVPRARAILLDEGFHDASSFNERFLAREHRGQGELHFASAKPVHLDLHWEVGVAYRGRGLPAQHFLARSVPRILLQRPILGPSAADLALLTCINGSRDRWNKIESLLALGVQIRDLPHDAWSDILAGAREVGCARRVVIGVTHVSRALGLDLPPAIAAAIAGDPVGRLLVCALSPDTLDTQSDDNGRREIADLLWKFATEDSLWRTLENLGVRLLHPGLGEWQVVELRPSLRWLYFALRPLRLTVKWSRRLLIG